MSGFEELLNQLVQEGKININRTSVVVEFGCGCNPEAAKVISKYMPKIYYANDINPFVFDPRFSQCSGYYFPREIDGMGVKHLICDALDVNNHVMNYDIGLFYRSLNDIKHNFSKNTLLHPRTSIYWLYLLIEKVYKSLNENGTLLIFEDKIRKIFKKIQEHGYIKFREISLLTSPYSKEVLLYALK